MIASNFLPGFFFPLLSQKLQLVTLWKRIEEKRSIANIARKKIIIIFFPLQQNETFSNDSFPPESTVLLLYRKLYPDPLAATGEGMIRDVFNLQRSLLLKPVQFSSDQPTEREREREPSFFAL